MKKLARIEYTKRQIAQAWGCDEKSVRNRCEKLGIEPLPNGKVDFHELNRAYLAHLDSARKRRDSDIDPEAAARKLSAEADIAESKAREAARQEAIKERQLYPAVSVRKVWRRYLAEIRSRNLEWLRKKMNHFDMKPMDKEQEENAFIEFFNELSELDLR